MATTATPQGTRRSTTGRSAAGRSSTRPLDRSVAYKSRNHLGDTDVRTRSSRSTVRNRRLGSQQQVSVRGRRVAAVKDNSRAVRLIALPVLAFVIGIGVVMWISGVTTAQSFQLSEAQKQSTTLANEIESLQRDAEVAQSGATIAKEAADLGMVAPDQSGILDAQGADVVTVREPNPEKDKEVTDVNSDVRKRGATSNPNQTSNVEGLAPQEAVVAGVGAQITSNNNGANTGGLPYQGHSTQQNANTANAGNTAPAAGDSAATPPAAGQAAAVAPPA